MGVSDMTEESKQANKGGKVRSFCRENPTLLLSLMYVDLTGIGILYSLLFYRQFGINIFDFAEIGDFLLAAFKAPGVTFFVLLAQVGLLLLLVAMRMTWREYVTRPDQRTEEIQADQRTEEIKEFAHLRRSIYRGETMVRALGVLIVAITLLLTAALPPRLANSQADAIKQGEQPQVTVQHRNFSRSAEQVTEPGLHLIGATQNTVFFYDVSEKRTIMVPQSQIVSIEVPQ
jgi:hypothetical protein